MSVYLVIGLNEPTFLSSNKGWGDVGRWIGAQRDRPEITRIVDTGISNNPAKLLAELSLPLPDNDIGSTLREMAGLLRGVQARVMVTDGMSS